MSATSTLWMRGDDAVEDALRAARSSLQDAGVAVGACPAELLGMSYRCEVGLALCRLIRQMVLPLEDVGIACAFTDAVLPPKGQTGRSTVGRHTQRALALARSHWTEDARAFDILLKRFLGPTARTAVADATLTSLAALAADIAVAVGELTGRTPASVLHEF